jgi:uncharacterized protein (TIGR02271 family)
MISQDQARQVMGSDLVTTEGDKVGKIGQIYLDDQTGQPEWATVNTGLFGTRESFVPLTHAELQGNDVVVPHSKSQIKDAPSVDVDGGHLSQDEEAQLYSHYGISYSENRSDSGLPDSGTAGYATETRDRDAVGYDTSGPTTDDAMTRSEERVRTGTEKVETGRARLRKWVETENVNVTVPVTKEKARLETEPITDANRGDALDGPDLSDEEHEVTLSEERPVVQKETVPVERVRLTKDVQQTEETVATEQRKERIAAEGDVVDVAGTEERDRTR